MLLNLSRTGPEKSKSADEPAAKESTERRDAGAEGGQWKTKHAGRTWGSAAVENFKTDTSASVRQGDPNTICISRYRFIKITNGELLGVKALFLIYSFTTVKSQV